jgi:hypothetical protein
MPSAQQQPTAEKERICRHHLLPVAVGEAERLLGRRQRNIDDRPIQRQHQLGDTDDDQDQPAPVGQTNGITTKPTIRVGVY